jgi:hypothetical protein
VHGIPRLAHARPIRQHPPTVAPGHAVPVVASTAGHLERVCAAQVRPVRPIVHLVRAPDPATGTAQRASSRIRPRHTGCRRAGRTAARRSHAAPPTGATTSSR